MRINNTVARWVGKDLTAGLGRQPGDILGCIHAITESKGCGYAAQCPDCPIRSAFTSAMRSGEPVHGVETEVCLSLGGDKVHLWLEVSADPLELDGQRHVILAMNNITARKQAEEALRRHREWLRVTLISIGDAVIAGDPAGRVTFLNPIAEALTGWRSDEALGQPIRNVFPIINEQTREPAEDIAARVLRERRIIGLANHAVLIAKDGREIPVEDSAAPILDAVGQVTGVVLVFHDVTEKRRAQEALHESQERLTLAQRAGGVGVLDWDLASGRAVWTAELETIFGLPTGAAEESYAKWAGSVHPDDQPRVEALLREWQESDRGDDRWQYRIVRQDGEERWISARGRIIRDSSGRPQRMISTHLDVTEAKRSETRLLEQAKSLAEADRQKDQFLAMLAHELRNPLAPIRYAVQILSALGPKESHLQRQQEIINRQVNHMGRLLDDLLDVSRISRGKIGCKKSGWICA
jgi:PAS domain S-box-containing protein